jgi:hypothetical protein
MVDDGLYDKVPLPDIVLGGHVMPFKAGNNIRSDSVSEFIAPHTHTHLRDTRYPERHGGMCCRFICVSFFSF